MSAGRKSDGGMSAQDATYQWLREHIGATPRTTGGFITEAEVAAASGTSRTPVREALLRLEAEGFLQIVPKKGAYIPPISDAEVEAVMQARLIVEDWCVRQALQFGDDLAIELARNIEAQEELLADPVAFIDCDRQFHRAIVQAAGNPFLADFYESLRERQIRMGLFAVASAEDRARTVLAEHNAILQALRDTDVEAASAAVAVHLANTLQVLRRPVLRNPSNQIRGLQSPGDRRR
jgi:DNA-binding GntR family transcriptional regulator